MKQKSKIEKMVIKFCPDGVQYRSIGDVAECFSGATPKTNVANYWDNGTIPWMSSGEVNNQIIFSTEKKISQEGFNNCSTRMVPINSVVIALAGQGKTRGKVAITKVPLCTNQSLCSIVPNNKLDSDYLYHFLSSQYQQLRQVSSGDGTRGGLNLQMIKAYRLPLPHIEIQKEIAKILNNFTELEAELEAELEQRRQQYKYYSKKLLKKNNLKQITLNDIGKVSMCKRIFKSETLASGEVPFYKIGTFGKKPDAFISQQMYDEYRTKFSFPKKGDVLLSASGTIGRRVIYDGQPAYFQDSNIIWIDNDESKVLNKFLYYLYATVEWKTEGGTIQRLYNDNLKKIKIPVPPLAEQARIVSILDKFDALVNDISIGLPAEIKARRQQYEYYRNKLLTFKEYAG